MSTFSGTFSITEASSPTEAGRARTEIETAGRDHFIFRFSSSATACHVFWHGGALVLPSAFFVLYLGFHARSNVKKLSHRRSYVMIGYYGLLWFAALLNLSWCFLQVISIFGFGVPLFLDMEMADRGKWVVWFTNKLLLTAAYGYILFVHFSKWRDKLPPRPAFYNYVVVMFATTAVMLFACGLSGITGGFGLWLYNLAVVCYHSLYLPFLYATFLADFFQGGGLTFGQRILLRDERCRIF